MFYFAYVLLFEDLRFVKNYFNTFNYNQNFSYTELLRYMKKVGKKNYDESAPGTRLFEKNKVSKWISESNITLH